MADAATELSLFCPGFIDVQGIQVAEQAGAEDDMGFGERHGRLELVAHLEFVVAAAGKHGDLRQVVD